MSGSLRLMAAALAAGAAVPLLGAPPAYADTASVVASNGAYFNAAGVDKPAEAPAAPPNVVATADGVSAENLPVASKAGTEDKVSFLYFDLFAVPVGSTITKAVVRLRLVENSPTDITVNALPERVQACQAGSQGFSGDDGANLASSGPDRLCTAFSARGKASKDGLAYEFDVTALVATWVEGVNDGVAFTRSDEAAGSTFQVVFDKASTAVLALEYAPPVDTTAPPALPPAPAVGAPDLGTGFAPGPGSGFVPSVPDALPPAVPNPTVNQPPVAAPEPALAPVALGSAPIRPTSASWLAGLAVLVLLGLLSLVLGDTRVPSARASRSRLTLALSSRQGLASAKAGFRAAPA